jgi:hypothetical protein
MEIRRNSWLSTENLTLKTTQLWLQTMSNQVTDCECTDAGFCPRHRCRKTEHWLMLCQTRPDYFQRWEQGQGPGQHRSAEPSLIKKALNFGAAVVRHVASGLTQVNDDTYQLRLDQCRQCASLNVERMVCQEANCGCYVERKARWASQSCPLGKWNAMETVKDE